MPPPSEIQRTGRLPALNGVDQSGLGQQGGETGGGSRLPARLAPISQQGALPKLSGTRLFTSSPANPMMGAPLPKMPGLSALGSGFNPPPPGLPSASTMRRGL